MRSVAQAPVDKGGGGGPSGTMSPARTLESAPGSGAQADGDSGMKNVLVTGAAKRLGRAIATPIMDEVKKTVGFVA